jgi:hypothetical protein
MDISFYTLHKRVNTIFSPRAPSRIIRYAPLQVTVAILLNSFICAIGAAEQVPRPLSLPRPNGLFRGLSTPFAEQVPRTSSLKGRKPLSEILS